MAMKHTNRSRLEADRYWYQSPSAREAIDGVLERNGRRSWDPRKNKPSLADLKGTAKEYGGKYAASRERLLSAAEVDVREIYDRRGRRVFVVTTREEPLSAAIRVNRKERAIRSADAS